MLWVHKELSSRGIQAMGQTWNYLATTIGRKQVVALTALGLSGFVLAHMLGNLLMFISPRAYNEYGHNITHGPIYELIEWGLVGAFAVHAFVALQLKVFNLRARPERYATSARGEKASSKVSSTMAIQGLLILVFVVLHLRTFKYGPHYTVDYGQGPIRDLFKLVVEVFQGPGAVVWYLAALMVLGLHLSHGIRSLFQTWGIHHPRYQCLLRGVAWLYALLVAGGFMAQPIFVYFFYQP